MEYKITSIRMEKNLLEKLRKIAKYECRSVNNQARIAIQAYIMEFEKEHGEIKIDIFE